MKANEYFLKGCEQVAITYGKACRNMAFSYEDGFAVRKNRKLALQYHQKACRQGADASCKEL